MAGLEGREGELTRNLSGGWKQRLALGAAILHQPEMLFLDEPTAGVDPLSRRAFWELLYELAEEGTTVLVTTHYMDEAEHCQNLAFIQRGRIIAQGSPAAIKGTHMRGQVLEIDSNRPDRAVPILRKMGVFDEVALYGAQIHAVGQRVEQYGSEIRQALEQEGIDVFHIGRIEPSLEDVFIASVRAQPTSSERIEVPDET
jgi:ABC-2 type transport system ATP-binding protein